MLDQNLLSVGLNRDGAVTRRELLRMVGGGTVATGSMAFLQAIGLNAAEMKKEGRACILVFLNGAPSQLETWDPKPNTETGGPTKDIQTQMPGVNFAEYWPKLAKSKDISLIRTIVGKEAAHERGAYHLRTGRRLTGSSNHPHIGSVAAWKLGDLTSDMPNFISVGNTPQGAGFLGVKFAPFVVGAAGRLPDNIVAGVPAPRLDQRMKLLSQQDADLAAVGASAIANEHQELYKRAQKMMASPRLKAFQTDPEKQEVKDKYGKSAFGQGCLVARRLVEAGIPFVEVQRGGWDMHENLWQRIPAAAGEVDQGLAALVDDLKSRGMLEKTLVICMGEFGRTPKINQRTPEVGRDHWARNFSVLMAGGGIRGGQCVGKTSDDGTEIVDRPVDVDDLFRTYCHCLKIDADEEMITPEGRPLRIVDAGAPVKELLA
jgi:hypothetical protein